MIDLEGTRLVAATEADHTLLSNLLELSIHDLSALFPQVRLGPDGRFGYPMLPLYWGEPDKRFAYLIEQDAALAGFILVTRGSPVSSDPDVLDIAEFFVLRRHRGSGVGQRAAFLLWRERPGKWTVRTAEAFPEARKPAFKLTIDFGPELGVRRSSAQITKHYTPAQLVGRQVIAAVNLGTRRIAGFESEVLVLGAVPEAGDVVLLHPDHAVPDGTRIS